MSAQACSSSVRTWISAFSPRISGPAGTPTPAARSFVRIDRDDVMHRAVAELGGPQPPAGVFAVGPIDLERLLDEPAHRLDVGRGLGDDPGAAQIGHADQRVGRQHAAGAIVAAPLAEDFFGEAGRGLGPGLDDGQRRELAAGPFEHGLEESRVGRVARADLDEPRHVQRDPLLVRRRPGVDFPDSFASCWRSFRSAVGMIATIHLAGGHNARPGDVA